MRKATKKAFSDLDGTANTLIMMSWFALAWSTISVVCFVIYDDPKWGVSWSVSSLLYLGLRLIGECVRAWLRVQEELLERSNTHVR